MVVTIEEYELFLEGDRYPKVVIMWRVSAAG